MGWFQRHIRKGCVLVWLVALPQTLAAQSSSSTTTSPDALVRANLSSGIAAKVKATSIASLAEAEAVVAAFNAYLRERTGYSLSRATVLRLAQAEWLARMQGKETIPVSQLASTATRLFVEKLGGPGARPPAYSVGKPYYVITPEKINAARLFYRRHAPGVTGSNLPEQIVDLGPDSPLPSVQKAFPIEALLALYVSVSEDLGFGITAVEENWRKRQADPLASPRGKPYGDSGYLVRRAVSRLLTDEVVNAILDLAY